MLIDLHFGVKLAVYLVANVSNLFTSIINIRITILISTKLLFWTYKILRYCDSYTNALFILDFR